MKLEVALKKLAFVTKGKNKHDLLSAEGKTPLAQACSLLGQSVGFILEQRAFSAKTVEDLCKAGKLQYRALQLPQNWWKKDHGPLLGYYQNVPVALFSDEKGYCIVSPSLGKKILVDVHTASEIAPTAHMLYPALSEEMGTFRALVNIFFRKKKKEYLLLFLAGALATITSFFVPFAYKVLFDKAIPHYNFTILGQVLLGLIVAAVGSSIFLLVRAFTNLRLNIKISHELQMSLWDRILKFPVDFFRKISRGDLIQRTLVFDTIRRVLSQNTLTAIVDSLFAGLYLIVMFYFSWKLALLGLGVILFATLFTITISFIKIRWDKSLLESNAEINTFLIAMIQGIDKLRTASAEKFVFSHWAEAFAKNQNIALKSKFLAAINVSINATLSLFSTFLIYGLVIWQRFHDPASLSLGGFLAFIAAFSPFSISIFNVLNVILTLIAIIPYWHRVQPLLKAELEIKKGQRPPRELKGKITLSGVFFRYTENSPFVLKNFQMEINPSEFVAVVGPSGCGKSTLCRLLIGFESPEKGSIQYDDTELKEILPNELRKQISFVTQERTIFSGTIYDNIICGGDFSYQEIQDVLNRTTFDQDMQRFPSGLETLLPSGGGLLSGGERQKVLLCRALIRKPRILILDEGLNSLQSVSQIEIINVLKSLGITVLFATHQLNLLTHADRIYVFEDGRVPVQGSFEELLEKSDYFRKLYESQLV